MECPDCGEKMSRDNTRVYAWHCPKCNDDYKDDYVMGYWKGFADAKFAAQQSVHPTLLTQCPYCKRVHDNRLACPESTAKPQSGLRKPFGGFAQE